MFIKNSFQTTALTWILSLGKKFKLYEFEEKPLTLWKKQSTWISCHADGELGGWLLLVILVRGGRRTWDGNYQHSKSS